MEDRPKKWGDVWEKVGDDINLTTFRMPVPGGWVVLTKYVGSNGVALTQTFVPDAGSEWKIEYRQ